MKKLVIIPAYNEALTLATLVEEISTCAPDYDYIIINDGSTDNTVETCAANRLNALHLPVNLGIGGAVQTGYRYAYKQGYDIAVQLDGDGQHDPAYLDKLVHPIENGTARFTIGSRYMDKSGFQSSWIRRIGIIWLSWLLTLVTRQRITDATSGFRAADRDVIRNFAVRYPIDYPEPETVSELSKAGIKVHEVPVEMRSRKHGSSSIRPIKAVYYMIKVSTAVLIARLVRRRIL